jgi:hypothetical protein
VKTIETGYSECSRKGTRYEESEEGHRLIVLACLVGGAHDNSPVRWVVSIFYDGNKLVKPGDQPWTWTSPCKSFQVKCNIEEEVA